jgi:hypothetical protein
MESTPRHCTKGILHPRSAVALGARVLCLAILVVSLTPHGTSASVGWCRSDPIVKIKGDLADIFVAAPLDAPLKVTGPTKIVLTIPQEVSAAAIVAGKGFGRGENLAIANSSDLQVTQTGIEVLIDVFVPATDVAMPVRVEFAPRVVGILDPAYAEGVANAWVSLSTEL